MLTLTELGPRVAAFIARGRKGRDLTPAEKRLAVNDPAAFDAVVQAVQAETLDDIRAEAALEVLQEDAAQQAAAERARQAATMDAERTELLALRHEQALELDAALADVNASLVGFQELNGKISALDRKLGQSDRNRASYGLMALVLKRTIRTHAPDLFKLLGARVTGFNTDGLSDATRPADYDLATRMGAPDPLDN